METAKLRKRHRSSRFAEMMQGAGISSALHYLMLRETIYFSHEFIPRKCPERERERAEGEVGDSVRLRWAVGSLAVQVSLEMNWR